MPSLSEGGSGEPWSCSTSGHAVSWAVRSPTCGGTTRRQTTVTSSPEPTRRARYRPLALILCLTLWACSERESVSRTLGEDSAWSDQSRGDARATAQSRREELAALEAIGYVDFDEEAQADSEGARSLRPDLLAPGYSLYDTTGGVRLVDREGREVHRWDLGGRVSFFELLEGGRLLVARGKWLRLLEWDGSVVWKLKLRGHHDAEALPDGSFLVLEHRPCDFQGRTVLFDGVIHVSSDGQRLDEWWTIDHLEDLHRLHPILPLDRLPTAETPTTRKEYDYYHTNTIEVLPATPLGEQDARFREGNWMLCLHTVHTVVILDPEEKTVLWSFGKGVLDFPHMPTMLPDGNILIFDNGKHRGHSRVLEVEPRSGEIVWSYRGDPQESFFSEFRGSSQRLPNGNTLICEAERGYAFEVTREGALVWDFRNPRIDGRRERMYRFVRHSASDIERLLSGR